MSSRTLTAGVFLAEITKAGFEVSLATDRRELILSVSLPGDAIELAPEKYRAFGEVFALVPMGPGESRAGHDFAWVAASPEGGEVTNVMSDIRGVEIGFLEELAILAGKQDAERFRRSTLVNQFWNKVGEEIERDERVVAARAAIVANQAVGTGLERGLEDLLNALEAEREERLQPFLYVADEREL